MAKPLEVVHLSALMSIGDALRKSLILVLNAKFGVAPVDTVYRSTAAKH